MIFYRSSKQWKHRKFVFCFVVDINHKLFNYDNLLIECIFSVCLVCRWFDFVKGSTNLSGIFFWNRLKSIKNWQDNENGFEQTFNLFFRFKSFLFVYIFPRKFLKRFIFINDSHDSNRCHFRTTLESNRLWLFIIDHHLVWVWI